MKKGFVLLGIVLLFACKNEPQNTEDGLLKLRLNVQTENGAPSVKTARTVYPQITMGDLSRYVIVGEAVAGDRYRAEFTNAEIESAVISIKVGTWDFTLDAYKDEALVLKAEIKAKSISESEDTLEFLLYTIKEGRGAISITLNFPADTGIASLSAVVDGTPETVPLNGTQGVFAKTNVDAGDYFVNFEFKDAGGTVIARYSELISVRANLTSLATITLTTADLRFTERVPSGLVVSGYTEDSISLNWDALFGAEWYAIQRADSEDGAFVDVGTSGSTEYTDPNLAAWTRYYYRVQGVQESGAVSATSAVVSGDAVPEAPVVSGDYSAVTWEPVEGAAGYDLYYNTINATEGATKISGVTSPYTLSNLSNITYYIWVKASNNNIETDFSSATILPVVGGTGQAGGIVFYDKGSYSDGWRYLEAAPADLSGTYQWGGYGTSCTTGTDVGTGKTNTETLTATGHAHTHPAAQAAVDYTYGGYDDWFLPSKDELNLMYTNLKANGLGGTWQSNYYWSSSQYVSNFAWDQYFGSGNQYGSSKYDYDCVRCVRAF